MLVNRIVEQFTIDSPSLFASLEEYRKLNYPALSRVHVRMMVSAYDYTVIGFIEHTLEPKKLRLGPSTNEGANTKLVTNQLTPVSC